MFPEIVPRNVLITIDYVQQFRDLLENARLEIQMVKDVNKSLKEFLIYGLKSEENIASLNSYFDEITHLLLKSTDDANDTSQQDG